MFGRRNWLWALALVGAVVLAGAPARATLIIDFEFFAADADLVLNDPVTHGQIIDTEYSPTHGVTFSADNVNISGEPDPAVAFETTVNHAEDPDLRGPPNPGNWDSGNLVDVNLGNILVIQEIPGNGNSTTCNSTDCTPPDDEGRRPAGSIFITFDTPITSFGFDLIDVEGPEEFDASTGFFAAFFTQGGTLIGDEVGFGSFAGVNGVVFGNNSANRIDPIIVADLVGPVTASSASFVEINMRGSGGIDNIVYTEVPEPGTLALFTIGLAGLGFMGWRRRRIT